MSKKLFRLVPRLLVIVVLTISVSALGAFYSGDVATGSVNQNHNWIGVWYTANGSTQVGSLEPKFTKGNLLAADSVSTSFTGSGNYRAKAELKISHANGVTHSKTMMTTASGSDSLYGTLWEPSSGFSIVLIENVSSGKITFKNS
ncbi:MAG: hypothetical protein LBH86_05470 [Oscillospiraceae bacterium]|jgi:hypothetical protein|nr:hypothetical protein [Oscillospiraceae bacterium]